MLISSDPVWHKSHLFVILSLNMIADNCLRSVSLCLFQENVFTLEVGDRKRTKEKNINRNRFVQFVNRQRGIIVSD